MKKKSFWRGRVKRGVGRGFEQRVDRGRSRPKAQEKQHCGKSHFYCRRFSHGFSVTMILDNYPTLQGSDQRILVISAPPTFGSTPPDLGALKITSAVLKGRNFTNQRAGRAFALTLFSFADFPASLPLFVFSLISKDILHPAAKEGRQRG